VSEVWQWVLLALLLANLLLMVWSLVRQHTGGPMGQDLAAVRAELLEALQSAASRADAQGRDVREEIERTSRSTRQELTQILGVFQQSLLTQGAEATRTQNSQNDAFGQQLGLLRHTLSETLHTQLQHLSESTARRMLEVRQTLEAQLAQLQASNSAKLEEMRATVDEKLQATLQARLGESFRQVADRLDQVHRGLGEMQTLAQGVGDLKHLLTNVKTRGMFGEAQLGALLEEVFVPDQYAAQVATRPGSRNLVDFAIRLPGRSAEGVPVWLPIDAKFPNEDYERLLDAQARADAAAADAAGKALEARIRLEARAMAEKYLEPPFTTDFAVLFLPTEGLYAEVLRRPGLMDSLQRDHRVTLAGPTTLLAILNSLHMGFRTLALEKQASEVWKVLGAVKTEFDRYGEWVAKVREQVQKAADTLDRADTRSKQMRRVLKGVEALPEAEALARLPLSPDLEEGLDNDAG